MTESITINGAVAPVPPPCYEASCEMTVPASSVQDLLDAIFPRPKGASDATLARRVSYGGRKGRSAMRRLLRAGFAGVIKFNDEEWAPCPPIRIDVSVPQASEDDHG